MKKQLQRYLIILCVSIGIGTTHSYAQLESAHWFFNYGGLDFTTGTPVAKPVNFWGYQHHGGTTMSTPNGNLLFHGIASSNQSSLLNTNGVQMDNGSGLIGHRGEQSVIAIPDPGNSNRYYVFQAHGMPTNVNSLPFWYPFMYSVVDMTLDGGLGGVVSGQKNIPLDGAFNPPIDQEELDNEYHATKVTATYHANGEDIWALVHRGSYDYDRSNGLSNVEGHFAAFLITSSGIQTTPVVSDEFPLFGGYFRISPNGKRFVATYYDKSEGTGVLALFDFDTTTGEISNPQKLMVLPFHHPTISGYLNQVYGVEFSPNSNRLYITMPFSYVDVNNDGVPEHDGAKLIQYNVDLPTTQDIVNSQTLLWHLEQVPFKPVYSLQLALDGKIYASRRGTDYLSVIKQPNNLGITANFQLDAFYLGSTNTGLGLPQFLSRYFQYEIGSNLYCSGQATEFEIKSHVGISAVTWDFGDSSSAQNTSTDLAPTHVYTQPGTYTVTAEVYIQFGTLIELEEEIIILEGAKATTPSETLLGCSQNGTTAIYNLTTLNEEILNGQDAQVFEVKYYQDQSSAEADTSSIITVEAYETSNTTIYAKVINTNTGCYALTEVSLTPVLAPQAISLTAIEVCDTKTLDGYTEIDLTVVAPEIQQNQPNTIISYFETFEEAENNTDAISNPENYLNITNPQIIYIRIDNPDIKDCFAITKVEFIVAETLFIEDISLEGCSPFDLTELNGIYESYTLSYYNNLIDAKEGINALTNTTSYITSNNTELYLRAEDSEGCIGVGSIELIPIDCLITQGISPDTSPGINDELDLVFLADRTGIEKIQIFNRYGRLVYDKANYRNEWNGVDNDGNELPTGTYFYVLELKAEDPMFGKVVKNWIYINRKSK